MKKGFWFILVLLPLRAWSAGLDKPSLYDQGIGLYQKGRYASAVKILKKAFKAQTDNWLIPQALGDCYLRLKNPEEAVRYYRQSLALHSENPALIRFLYGEPQGGPPKPPLPVATGNRTIEASISGGANFPFQSNGIAKTWTRGVQTSLFLGVRPLPDWCIGLQMDVLSLSSFNPISLTAYNYAPYSPGNSGNHQIEVSAGDLALIAKNYLVSPDNGLSLYALAGPGVFLLYQSGGINQVYNTNTGNTINETIPEYYRFAPSAQAGIGLTVKNADAVDLFLEYRMVYAFLADPVFYSSINLGLLLNL
jgi:tetratricopeptide (TPR) repeat protein